MFILLFVQPNVIINHFLYIVDAAAAFSFDIFSRFHLLSFSSLSSFSVVGLGIGSCSKLCFLGSRGSSFLGALPNLPRSGGVAMRDRVVASRDSPEETDTVRDSILY